MDDIGRRMASSKVLKAVGDIEAEKEAARVLPRHALLRDLEARTGMEAWVLWDALEDLEGKGFIEKGRTINSYWIRLKK